MRIKDIITQKLIEQNIKYTSLAEYLKLPKSQNIKNKQKKDADKRI